MEALVHNFQVGHLYNRQKDIHDQFGGNRQSGISNCVSYPLIFLFTGELGHQYGYKDDWDGRVFRYTGEGQSGDMVFTKGNKAIRDHVHNAKSLLLFKHIPKAKSYMYMGEFVCESYEIINAHNKDKKSRKTILFHLIDSSFQEPISPQLTEDISMDALQNKAYAVSEKASASSVKEGLRKFHERSAHVKAYVLKRANGVCECCGAKAPFFKKDGTPYLEPHHIRQLSDNGLDRPDWVAAITPNCHREIHHGQNGSEKNELLRKIIQEKEGAVQKGIGVKINKNSIATA